MSEKINAASRMLSFLQRIPHNDQKSVLEVWAEAFSVPNGDPHARGYEVSQRLHCLFDELHDIRQQLQARRFSERSYHSKFAKLAIAFSPYYLNTTWNQVRQYITDDVLTALEFSADIIEDEEEMFSEESFDNIKRILDELRGSLPASTLSARLKALIARHIALIDRAMAEYPLRGAKSFVDATRSAMGEIFEVYDEVKAETGSQEMANLRHLWDEIGDASDTALRRPAAGKLSKKVWAAIARSYQDGALE